MSKKKRKAPPLTVAGVIKTILVVLACIILLAGIIARVNHYINNHLK